jgi:hypothetical protein
MSDSGLPGSATFAEGHTATPLHVDNPNPVAVDISGDIDSFELTVPTFAQITVTGNAYNFGFEGENLSSSQTTSIDVTGDISYRGDLSSVPLSTPLPAALFNAALSGDPGAVSGLSYDAKTGTLTFQGQMSSSQLAFLLNPTELVLNSSGKSIIGDNGQDLVNPVILTAVQQAAIQQLYAASQTATLGDAGLSVAGPGHFTVSAANIDLGISGGIQVLSPDSPFSNPALAAISPYGADLSITTTGYLDMTSSLIIDEGLLGSMQLNVGTTLDVGGALTSSANTGVAKGIFTTGGGAISVTATGNVDVDGSRIATYDGGNIDIRSTDGNVDAGSGGTGFANEAGVYLNSKTGELVSFDDEIPGSGILATALSHAPAPLGNITINTPKGSINASAGGISQVALSGAHGRNSSIILNAGDDINASGSGIIGDNLQLNAGGSINGILVSTGGISVQATLNANVTAFAKGDVSISAGGNVSGTVMTSGSASVSGESITAALISASVSTSGSTTGSAIGVPQSNVPKEDTKVADDASTMAAMATEPNSDDEKKKKNKTIALAQRTGRVTVIMPGKNNTSHL